jgi:hypothetical protein
MRSMVEIPFISLRSHWPLSVRASHRYSSHRIESWKLPRNFPSCSPLSSKVRSMKPREAHQTPNAFQDIFHHWKMPYCIIQSRCALRLLCDIWHICLGSRQWRFQKNRRWNFVLKLLNLCKNCNVACGIGRSSIVNQWFSDRYKTAHILGPMYTRGIWHAPYVPCDYPPISIGICKICMLFYLYLVTCPCFHLDRSQTLDLQSRWAFYPLKMFFF